MMSNWIKLIALAGLLTGCMASGKPAEKETATDGDYRCLPCGYDCDTIRFTATGTCPHCNMELVKKESISHQEIEPAAVCELTATTILLDVRTPEEFNGTAAEKFGALKGAINIPVQELEKRIGELTPYKNKKILVYCSHSHRSPRASYLLTQQGFTDVINMKGGMSVWKEQVKDPSCNQRIYQNQQ